MEVNYVSIQEVATALGINKSRIHHYVKIGILKPDSIVGKLMIFDEVKIKNKLSSIEKLKSKGLSLKDIKEKLDKK